MILQFPNFTRPEGWEWQYHQRGEGQFGDWVLGKPDVTGHLGHCVAYVTEEFIAFVVEGARHIVFNDVIQKALAFDSAMEVAGDA